MTKDALTTEQKKILGVALVPLLLALLSVSIVNVVLPSVQETLGASNTALQWILAGYTLAFGVLLVPAGRAGDIQGRGRLFVTGLVLFGLGALAAGFAPNALMLNLARVVMGLGSGFLNPQTIGLLQQYFFGKQRGVAFGMLGATVGVSVAIGPVMGGSFIALWGPEWGWRASFLVNVPIVITAVVLAFAWFPASAWKPVPGESPDLDLVGTAIFALAILVLMFPFLQHTDPRMFALLPVGAALIVGWVMWERRYKRRERQPMVDIELFRTPSFANGALLIFLYFAGMTSVWVIVALFLQNGMGFSALQAGMIGLPSAFLSVISSRWAGNHVFSLGRKMVVSGMVIALIGLVATCVVVLLNRSVGLNIWWIMLTMSLVGGAQGTVISPNQALSLSEVPVTYAGAAGGVIQAGQRVGTAIGIAGITGVFFAVQAVSDWNGAFIAAFTIIGLSVVLAGLVGLFDLYRSRGTIPGQNPTQV